MEYMVALKIVKDSKIKIKKLITLAVFFISLKIEEYQK